MGGLNNSFEIGEIIGEIGIRSYLFVYGWGKKGARTRTRRRASMIKSGCLQDKGERWKDVVIYREEDQIELPLM